MIKYFMAVPAAIFVSMLVSMVRDARRKAEMSETDLEQEAMDVLERERRIAHGPLNIAMVCPHCREKGAVRTFAVERDSGISGGKATAAVLTAGISLLATGLSRKDLRTRAHCENCENSWEF